MATDNDPWTLIQTPLGVRGSGRVRYAAAMDLFQAGKLNEAQLEVYREVAAHDDRDPLSVLAERGLPGGFSGPPDPVAVLFQLAVNYVSGFDHPGQAEVRAALARAERGSPPSAPRPLNKVSSLWLETALAAIDPAHRPLADAIRAAAPHLHWVTYDKYPRSEIGDEFSSGHACALLLAKEAPYRAADVNLGLFLMAPHLLYRDHHHPAPELYVPLTGPHGWRFRPNGVLIRKAAHDPVWNPPNRPHLIKVGAVPFLSLFVWTRNVTAPARVLPAQDWTALEDLRLG